MYTCAFVVRAEKLSLAVETDHVFWRALLNCSFGKPAKPRGMSIVYVTVS